MKLNSLMLRRSAAQRPSLEARRPSQLQCLLQFRQELEQVADQAIVGDREDRRVGILVDGDDDLRILHAGEVLDRAGYATGNVEVGGNHLAGLADLEVVRRIAGIDSGARCTDRRAKLVGNRLEIFLEILRRLESAP